MAVVEYLPVATGGSANIDSQVNFAGSTYQINGVQPGLAQSKQANKLWRQSSVIGAMIANFIANNTGANVLDDGNVTALLTNFQTALGASISLVGLTQPTQPFGDRSTKIANTNFVQLACDPLAASISTNNSQTVANTNAIAAINTRLATNDQNITAINSHLSTIDGRLAAHDTHFTTVDSHLATLDSQISGLNGQFGPINSHLSTIDGQITAINNHLATLDGQVAGNTNSIGTINTRLGNLDASIANINSQIGTINGHLGTLDSQISDLYTKDTNQTNAINAINGHLGTHDTQISDLYTRDTNQTNAINATNARLPTGNLNLPGRAWATPVQNPNAFPIFVAVSGQVGSGGATMRAYIGPGSDTQYLVGGADRLAASNSNPIYAVQVCFIVAPGWWYQVTQSAGNTGPMQLVSWAEYSL